MDQLTRRDTIRAGLIACSAGLAGCLDGGRESSSNGQQSTASDESTDNGAVDDSADDARQDSDGETDSETDDGEAAAVRWTYDVGGRLTTLVDGTLYGQETFPGGSGGILALDAATGEREWVFGETGGFSTYTEPVVGDAVYVGFGDDAIGSGAGAVHAIETADGTERWQTDTGSIYHPPRLLDDGVFVADDVGQVTALDAASGDRRWTVTPVDADPRPPATEVRAVVDGTVYAATDDILVALDVETGGERWRYEPALGRVRSVTVADRVYCETTQQVSALVDGDERWRTDSPNRNRLHGVTGDTVYIDERETLVALNRADGTERWREAVSSRPVTHVTDSRVYTGTDRIQVFTATGETVWTASLDGSTVGGISVVDGTVYAQTETAVYRVEGGETAAVAEIPDVGSHVVGDDVYAATMATMYALDL